MTSQNTSTSQPFTRLYMGELRNPDEVAEALSERSDEEKQKVGHRWLFCGNVEPAMFDALRRSPDGCAVQRLTGFSTPSGASYAVLTHQVGGHQHRLVLPVFDTEVQQGIHALTKEAFGFLLSNDGQPESLLLLQSQVTGYDFQGLPGLNEVVSVEAVATALAELPKLLMRVAEPDIAPSMLDMPLASISVSFVMPFGSIARVNPGLAEVLA